MRRSVVIVGSVVAAVVALVAAPLNPAQALPNLVRVSVDPYTDAQAQHQTEVEPDTFSYGKTIVAAFQVGRVSSGGASNVGWATSTNKGTTWKHGYLTKTTGNTGGPYGQVSDASVAFDKRHNTWLISYLGIRASGAVDVEASRSTDGGLTWGAPVTVSSTGAFFDKNWSVCDNTNTSPYYGHCYTEYDNADAGDAEAMRTSTDGGLTWGAEKNPADGAHGLGGQPVVAPDGRVVVPFESADVNQERSFSSTNGGTSWSASVEIAPIHHHQVAGLEDARVQPDELRESALPSAEIDGAGTVYVTWADCSFRSGCSSNDIVLSTSATGATWSGPTRIPIDAVNSTVDHFAPGIGVDPSTSGNTTRLALTYYFYPTAACTTTTCQLEVGYVSSTDQGTTWTTPRTLAGPMKLAWLPNTSQGRMFGDYISTSVLRGGNAFPVFPVAQSPTTSAFRMAMFAPVGGLPV